MGLNAMPSAVVTGRLESLSSSFEPGFFSSTKNPSHDFLSFYHNQPYNFGSTDSFNVDENTTGDTFFNGSISSNTACDTLLLPLCVGCGEPIKDQYLLRVAPNLEWHIGCLKCANCGQVLDESHTCFVKEGKTYCKRDYTRLFGAKCNKCEGVFGKNDFVMRAKDKIYHIDCFRCVACNKQLIPGDAFALRTNGLLCKADHDNTSSHDPTGGIKDLRHTPEFSSPGSGVSVGLSPSSTNGVHTPSGGIEERGRKRNIFSQKRKDAKTTRVRTVLNEKQLHTLRTCYAANCRPDALMKEQLTEMTGLSARVIRVWFQNKRCKDKKRSIALKQMQNRQAKVQTNCEQGGNANGSGGLENINGPATVAADPVRDDLVHDKGVEVHDYQQPAWKALSEFALQSEIEQPAFQQLMSHFSDPGQSSISDLSEICSIPSVSSSSMDASATCSTPLFPETNAPVCC